MERMGIVPGVDGLPKLDFHISDLCLLEKVQAAVCRGVSVLARESARKDTNPKVQ